jgi:hypothetical protein
VDQKFSRSFKILSAVLPNPLTVIVSPSKDLNTSVFEGNLIKPILSEIKNNVILER